MSKAKTKKKTDPIPRYRITSQERPGVVYYTYGPDIEAATKNAEAAKLTGWEIERDGEYFADRNVIEGARDLADEVVENAYAKAGSK